MVTALVLLLSGTSQAEVPKFDKGGFIFTIQYGPGLWALDKAQLDSQVLGLGDTFIAEAQNTHTATLKASYSILGFASVGVDFTGTGWNVFDTTRGGAGFLAGTVAWQPLQLVWMKKEERPLPLDASLFFGAGYGIAGQHVGMDGLIYEAGLQVDWFFTKYFGVGLFARGIFPQWDKIYWDFNNRQYVNLPKGPGGSFWTLGLSLHFRAGE